MNTDDNQNNQQNISSRPPVPKKSRPWGNLFSSIQKSNRNFDWFKTIRYIYPITIIIIIGVLSWFMSFLYNNVYSTMSQAAELSGLKAKISEERLNKKDFDQIISQIQDKENLAGWVNQLPASSTPFAYGLRPKLADQPEINIPAAAISSTPSSTVTSTPAKKTTTP